VKNPLKLSLDEIETWEEFQDLVQSFFEALVAKEDNQVKNVRSKKTGRGGDGGRDILVELDMHDGIQAFKRTWVVQCKAERTTKPLNGTELSGIRDLLDQNEADGYLLICKGRASSKMTKLLEDLEKTDRLRRCYTYWDGPQFCNTLYPFDELIKTYFPIAYAQISAIRTQIGIDKLMEE